MLGASPIASTPIARGDVREQNSGGPIASFPVAANPNCATTETNVVVLRPGTNPAEPTFGHSSGPSYEYYRLISERRKKRRQQLEDEKKRQLALRYAARLADAFAKADAEDAQSLADSARRLERLLIETDLRQNYLVTAASNLIKAAQAAADMENRRRIEEQLQAAAVLAARLEEELRDEEEAIFLLLA